MDTEIMQVLLVEDSPDDEKMTLRALKKSAGQTDIVVKRDGEEALDYLFGSPPPPLPTVVLLDLKLPKVNGFEVLQRIRAEERTRLLPVVVLTSSDETPDIERSYRLGANSYICKPVEFEAYLRVVNLLGLYWVDNNRWPVSSR